MVKWDAAKDQFMFLFLFSESTISREQCDQIIKAWPEKFGDKPTVRAIQEHVTVLKKQLAKETGITVGPKIGGKVSAGAAPMTPQSTQKKARAKSTPKRKREVSEDSEEFEGPLSIKKETHDRSSLSRGASENKGARMMMMEDQFGEDDDEGFSEVATAGGSEYQLGDAN